MFRASWLSVFFASILLLVFILVFPASIKVNLIKGEAHLGQSLSDSPLFQQPTGKINKPVKLVGKWYFVKDEFLAPKDLLKTATNKGIDLKANPLNSLLNRDASFKCLSLPLHHNLFRDGNNSGTYLIALHGLSNTARTGSLGILFNKGCNIQQAYFFGDKVPAQNASTRYSNLATNSNFIPLNSVNASSAVGSSNVRYLMLNYRASMSTVRCNAPVLGSLEQLMKYHSKQVLKNSILITVFVTVALYAFGMFFYFRINPENVWLGLWSLGAAVYFWNQAGFWDLSLGHLLTIDTLWVNRLSQIAVIISGPLAVNYYRHSLNADFIKQRFAAANLVTALILCVFVALIPSMWISKTPLLLLPFLSFQFLVVLFIFIRCCATKNDGESLIIIGTGILFILALLADSILQNAPTKDDYLSQYAWTLLVIANCVIQSSRVSKAFNLNSIISASLAAEVKKKNETLEVKNRMLLRVQSQLEKSNRELKTLTITDALTGAYNRLYFDSQFQMEWMRSMREQESFSLLLLDIDHFKRINDVHGHLAGDHCLQIFSKWLQSMFKRANDVVCRYGGEEFAVLLPKTTPAQALQFAEQMRKLVESTPIVYADAEFNITVSIGLCGTVPQRETQASDLFKSADKALYYIKHNGRNGIKLENMVAQSGIANDLIR